jgi:transcriptional antiterminator NusG
MADQIEPKKPENNAAQDEKVASVNEATKENNGPTVQPVIETVVKKRWYVVHAYSGFENFVRQALLDRVRTERLEELFGDILVPTEKVVELRGGQKCENERKFFPGYVLVEMEMNDKTWHLVKSIPKVLGFIGGTSDKPAPITTKEAEAILQRVRDSSDKPKPKVLFEMGEVVRVINGPFADFNGVVEEVNYEKNRMRVAVLIFGRSTPVELQFDQVEKG